MSIPVPNQDQIKAQLQIIIPAIGTIITASRCQFDLGQ